MSHAAKLAEALDLLGRVFGTPSDNADTQWLLTLNPRLMNRRPLDLLANTADSAGEVCDLLLGMAEGVTA